MTRWLQAARQASEAGTKPTKPTKPTSGAIGGGANTTGGSVLSVLSVLSEGGNPAPVRPAAETAIPLDPEGLPCAACPVCGCGGFWKPAAQPFEGPGWRCEGCAPPKADLWRHACAVPVGDAA